MPHGRLLLKVKAMGIGSPVANWIESWLSDRKQRVVINGKCSGWSELSSGAPQVSVLGPILFVIFINDIEDGICDNILKFADDTKLFCKIGSDINFTKFRADLRKLYNWSEDWQMLFNLDKCKIILPLAKTKLYKVQSRITLCEGRGQKYFVGPFIIYFSRESGRQEKTLK